MRIPFFSSEAPKPQPKIEATVIPVGQNVLDENKKYLEELLGTKDERTSADIVKQNHQAVKSTAVGAHQKALNGIGRQYMVDILPDAAVPAEEKLRADLLPTDSAGTTLSPSGFAAKSAVVDEIEMKRWEEKKKMNSQGRSTTVAKHIR